MRFLTILTTTTLFTIATLAQVNSTELDPETLPCGSACAIRYLEVVRCHLADAKSCLCTNRTLQEKISECVQAECNSTDQNTVTKLLQETCKGFPQPDRGFEIIRASIILAVISVPLVVLRLVSRVCIAHQVWWDDWFSFATAAILIPITGFQIDAELGSRQSFWTIPLQNLMQTRKLSYDSQIQYIIVQTLTKLSILLLYLRMFPNNRFRRYTKIVIFLVSVRSTALLITTICQCLPTNKIWDLEVEGKCINLQVLASLGAASNIIEDIIIILLPTWQLNGLQFSFWERASLIFIFTLGCFAFITSIVRMKFVIAYRNTIDTTWNNTNIIIWSLIEQYTALIINCIIPIHPLLTKYLPIFFLNLTNKGRSSLNPSWGPPQNEDNNEDKNKRPSSKLAAIQALSESDEQELIAYLTGTEVDHQKPRAETWYSLELQEFRAKSGDSVVGDIWMDKDLETRAFSMK